MVAAGQVVMGPQIGYLALRHLVCSWGKLSHCPDQCQKYPGLWAPAIEFHVIGASATLSLSISLSDPCLCHHSVLHSAGSPRLR